MPEALQHPISFVIALSLVTYLHVVFGEMVPKNIALAGPPERMALILAPVLMGGFATVLRPVLWSFNAVGNLTLRILGIEPKDEVTSAFTRNEVAAMVSESHDDGLLEDNDEALLLGGRQLRSAQRRKPRHPARAGDDPPRGRHGRAGRGRGRRGLLPLPPCAPRPGGS